MPQLLEQQKLFLGAYDITTSVRRMSEALSVAELPATTFGSDTETNSPGLKARAFVGEGFWLAGASGLDTVLSGYERVNNVPLTVAAVDGSVGSVARSHNIMLSKIDVGAAVGELLPVEFSAAAMDAAVRGEMLYYATATADVTGTAVELGAVATGEKLYARLHVFGGGTALAVKVQSDTTATFGSPTDVVTFTVLATTVTATYAIAAAVTGTNADTFWRITATAAAGRSFAVFTGIQ